MSDTIPQDIREKAYALVPSVMHGTWRVIHANAIASALLAHEREVIERCAKVAETAYPKGAFVGNIIAAIRETAR